MAEALRIAVAGLGTVGAGVVKLINARAAEMTARTGRMITITTVSARDRNRDRGIDVSGYAWVDDARDIAARDDVDVVVELIGGSEGVAKDLVEASLRAGKSVVTANKALIAIHGNELARLAEENGVALAYEAAVAGGIPIIKALREGLAGNAVSRVSGILNGTCNYILTEMRETGRDFAGVLADAQALGYAEADPTFDVDGIDAAHKLAIMAAIAFKRPVDFDGVSTEGIRKLSSVDIEFARELDYRIKLLGVAELNDGAVLQTVRPCMVSRDAPIAKVESVTNAVVVEGDFVGQTILEGPGAGEGPTASSVASDIIDIAAGRTCPVFGVRADSLQPLPAQAPETLFGRYYIRWIVKDQAGVIAEISSVLRDHRISIESLLQRGDSDVGTVPLVIITHGVVEADVRNAVAEISDLDCVVVDAQVIRIVEN